LDSLVLPQPASNDSSVCTEMHGICFGLFCVDFFSSEQRGRHLLYSDTSFGWSVGPEQYRVTQSTSGIHRHRTSGSGRNSPAATKCQRNVTRSAVCRALGSLLCPHVGNLHFRKDWERAIYLLSVLERFYEGVHSKAAPAVIFISRFLWLSFYSASFGEGIGICSTSRDYSTRNVKLG